MVTATKTGRPRGLRRSKAPKRWRKILSSIPGYDPFAQAEDCWFDEAAADHYIEFIETCCTHIEGALAGRPFLLETWQKAIVANLFGWHMLDFLDRPTRRYTRALIYVPRKNGKTPLVAAIHNALFFDECFEPEAGQINNLAAASREQATKLYRHISGQIANEAEMKKRCQRYATTKSITKPDESVTKVIPSDGNVAHGDNPYLQAIDELHTQPNDRLYEAMTSAMASANRVNQLLLMITTADVDRPSICNREYDYACRVRDNKGDRNKPGYDPRYLPVIYEAMHVDKHGRSVEDEDWTSEATWAKANPNLGVSVSLDYLRTACHRAQADPLQRSSFKRLSLNVRTGQLKCVIPMDAWDACESEIDWSLFAGRRAVGALDIGATRDFTAFTLAFPHDDGAIVTIPLKADGNNDGGAEGPWTADGREMIQILRASYTIRTYFWLPERPVKRDANMMDLIDAWTEQGFIRRTGGDVVDYDQVAADIVEICEPYSLEKIAVDQGFQGHHSTQDLQKQFGAEAIVPFRQGILSLAAPFRELVEMILAGQEPDSTGTHQCRLYHDGSPVMRWMVSNVTAEERGGLIKPSKDRSTEKIDGVTSATMAIGVGITLEPDKESVYEKRGIRSV